MSGHALAAAVDTLEVGDWGLRELRVCGMEPFSSTVAGEKPSLPAAPAVLKFSGLFAVRCWCNSTLHKLQLSLVGVERRAVAAVRARGW